MLSQELIDRVNTMSYLYDVPMTKLMRHMEEYDASVTRDLVLDDVEREAAELSRWQPEKIVVAHTMPALREAAMIEWSRYVGVPVSETKAWDAAHPQRDNSLLAFGHNYRPDIFFPDGKASADELARDRYNSHLQKALIYDQLRAVTEATTFGGDDNWFDYLPGGIAILRYLQSEFWDQFVAYLINDFDQEESTSDRYPDIYMWEVQSDLLSSLMIDPAHVND